MSGYDSEVYLKLHIGERLNGVGSVVLKHRRAS
jgi:hypothetical protein